MSGASEPNPTPEEIAAKKTYRNLKRISGFVELIATETDFVLDHLAPLQDYLVDIEVWVKNNEKSSCISLDFIATLKREVSGSQMVHKMLLNSFRSKKLWGKYTTSIITMVEQYRLAVSGKGDMPDYEHFAKEWDNDLTSFAQEFSKVHLSILVISQYVIRFMNTSATFSKALSESQPLKQVVDKVFERVKTDFVWLLGRPVHRPTRYNLLWKAILKYTDENQKDFPALQKAYEHSRTVGSKLNNYAIQAESDASMKELCALFPDGKVSKQLVKPGRNIRYFVNCSVLSHSYEHPLEDKTEIEATRLFLQRIESPPSSASASGSDRRSIAPSQTQSRKSWFGFKYDSSTTAKEIFEGIKSDGFLAVCNDGIYFGIKDGKQYKASQCTFLENNGNHFIRLVEQSELKAIVEESQKVNNSDDNLSVSTPSSSSSTSTPEANPSTTITVPKLSLGTISVTSSQSPRSPRSPRATALEPNDPSYSEYFAFCDENNKILVFFRIPAGDSKKVFLLLEGNSKHPMACQTIPQSSKMVNDWIERASLIDSQTHQTQLSIPGLGSGGMTLRRKRSTSLLNRSGLKTSRNKPVFDSANDVSMLLLGFEHSGRRTIAATFANTQQYPSVIVRAIKSSHLCTVSPLTSIPVNQETNFHALILVFSCVDVRTFNRLSEYLVQINQMYYYEKTKRRPPIILVGTKCDQRGTGRPVMPPNVTEEQFAKITKDQQHFDSLQVKKSTAELFKETHNLHSYIEIVATQANQIDELFETVATLGSSFKASLTTKPLHRVCKVLLAGPNNSGKHSLASSLTDQYPSPDLLSNIRSSQQNKIVKSFSTILQIDSAQTILDVRFFTDLAHTDQNVAALHISSSDLIVYCIPVDQPSTTEYIDAVGKQVEAAFESTGHHDCPSLIVGTKLDLRPTKYNKKHFIHPSIEESIAKNVDADGTLEVSSKDSLNIVLLQHLLIRLSKDEQIHEQERLTASTTGTISRKFGKLFGAIKTSNRRRKDLVQATKSDSIKFNMMQPQTYFALPEAEESNTRIFKRNISDIGTEVDD